MILMQVIKEQFYNKTVIHNSNNYHANQNRIIKCKIWYKQA